MILVLLGTSHYSFTRLARAADDYAAHTGEEVFIQLGYTAYEPRQAGFARFLGQPELLVKIDEAELVIAQGGFGSIAHCLRAGKPLVAVPRQPELGEAEHRQDELVRELEKQGLLTGVYDIADLPRAIAGARGARFQTGARHRVPPLIQEFMRRHET